MWTCSRIAASAVLFALLAVAQAHEGLDTSQIGGQRDGISSSGGGTVYYVNSSTGLDTNNGRTPTTAWQSITHVLAQVYKANDEVLFTGNQTITGSLALTTTTNPSGRFTIGSYGTGQATIVSGNAAACVTATNIPAITINNIICTGGTDTISTTAGISIVNSQAGNTTLAGPTITNTTVSGYGSNGIEIKGTNGTSGFNGIDVIKNVVHDVTGNSGPLSSCIQIYSTTAASSNVHSNATVSGNTVSNCIGTTGQTNWTGSGITVAFVIGATIQNNVAHDFGNNSTSSSGPVGIWTYAGTNVTIQYNEAYNGKTGSGGVDGDGFDCDGGSNGVIMQYNYSHNNVGTGFLVFAFSGGNNIGCTVRWNISQNDGSNTAYASSIDIGAATGATVTNCQVYNNTTYTNVSSAFGSNEAGSGLTCQVSNNIFYTLYTSGDSVEVATPSSLTLTGNDYYGGAFSWNGTGYSTFSAWQTASGQEKIGGVNVGLTSEPRLVVYGGGGTIGGYVPASLTQYQLQSGSPMLSAGLNLTTQYSINPGSVDYYGVSVSTASLPVGAGQQITWTSGTGTCAQATTFLARTSSPPVTTQQQYNALICGGVADGWFTVIDFLYKLATDSSTDAALNLASTSFSLTTSGSITFTANRGYASDGSTGYLNTNDNPTTSGGQYVKNSAMYGVYDLTSRSSSASAFQIATTDVTNLSGLCLVCIFGAGTGQFQAYVNETIGVVGTATETNSQGFWLMQRTGASAEAAYTNKGASQALVAQNASSALSNGNFTVGGVGGVGGLYTTDQIAYAFGGSALSTSAAQAVALMAYRINADATALSINAF